MTSTTSTNIFTQNFDLSISEDRAHELYGAWLSVVARSWRSEIDSKLADHGLTHSRWLALLVLSRFSAPVSQLSLAGAMGVSAATLVPTLDWLESRGMVVRRTSEADRRRNEIALTSKARVPIESIGLVLEEIRADIFRDVETKDLLTALKVFFEINKSLTRLKGDTR